MWVLFCRPEPPAEHCELWMCRVSFGTCVTQRERVAAAENQDRALARSPDGYHHSICRCAFKNSAGELHGIAKEHSSTSQNTFMNPFGIVNSPNNSTSNRIDEPAALSRPVRLGLFRAFCVWLTRRSAGAFLSPDQSNQSDGSPPHPYRYRRGSTHETK
jgi:hypothetical protein